MPRIDVSELLSDPDFCETFDVIRGTKGVDADGFTVPPEGQVVAVGVVGVVQPASARAMQRLPEGTIQEGTISIWTQYPLTSGVVGQTADIISYAAAQYTVLNVSDWSHYGEGYIEVLATLRDLSPAA